MGLNTIKKFTDEDKIQIMRKETANYKTITGLS